jgi:hypothetical protein
MYRIWPNYGTRLVFELFRGSNDFIVQKVYLLRLMPVCVGLKVPKREIFDRSDFSDFYTIKSSWVGDLLVKIITYYFNF